MLDVIVTIKVVGATVPKTLDVYMWLDTLNI